MRPAPSLTKAKDTFCMMSFLYSSPRMHLALKAYQELLTTVHEMDHSQEEAVRNSSHILKSEAFNIIIHTKCTFTVQATSRSISKELFLLLLHSFVSFRKHACHLQIKSNIIKSLK